MSLVDCFLSGNLTEARELIDKRITELFKEKLELIKQFKRQALHAIKLSFNHPITNKHLDFVSPLPQDIKNLINILEHNDS